MKYENLITQLCEVIKESEKNAVEIYDNLESISTILENLNLTKQGRTLNLKTLYLGLTDFLIKYFPRQTLPF